MNPSLFSLFVHLFTRIAIETGCHLLTLLHTSLFFGLMIAIVVARNARLMAWDGYFGLNFGTK